ncbi:PREDICTED: cation channel sperm-associated protein subunit delta [Chrysochloris asiatica]|uniref:Cation channel sperm-associated auxiliary subunit delta n=1 Tax=Chrysochloris asiatica TaxID=185453 RepID=A0A9B0WV43_CHRAS|nr:PREDICTED: cation channel sperm-associated protein subunit delta [Chrysochloris asiatica]
MLVLMLVMSMTVRLWPLVTAVRLCRTKVFFSTSNFDSNSIVLTIPTSMHVGVPSVTSAHFAGSVLLFVINQKVYIYNYAVNSWSTATGIDHPVSHITGDNCCYSENPICFEELVGFVGGIFSFHSLSQTGLLVVDGKKAKFAYSEHPLNRSFGLPFDYNGTLNVHTAPGQTGILVFWFENSLLVSRNAGQLVNTVTVNFASYILYPSVFEANLTIHSIATGQSELVVLTWPSSVYYGSLGTLSDSIIKMEYLHGYFEDQMHTIDMNSNLTLKAIIVPQVYKSPIPLVTVSNPHSLGLQVSIKEMEYTLDGNIKYQMNIFLMQQHHSGRADPNFTSSIKRPTISTVTLDIANKEVSCIDFHPLTALISIGCDVSKKLVIQNNISACSKNLLSPVTLQANYSYIIPRDNYDPTFMGRKATKDLRVFYPYDTLGCPRLVYYDSPWKPVVELWKNGKFQEVVEAEYVLLEVNGLFTYTYSLTAATAFCKSQPQNWTSILAATGRPFSWDRENYVSCHQYTYSAPLRWPGVPYQILGGATNNKVVFDQRNGMYIFHLSIVDPYYSYCSLKTTFSVYVYGAFPPTVIRKVPSIILLVLSMLLALWLIYAIPKMSHFKTGKFLPSLGCLDSLT